MEFLLNGVVFGSFSGATGTSALRLLPRTTNQINACAIDAAGNRGCGIGHTVIVR